MTRMRVGVIGDFEPAYHSHFATNAASPGSPYANFSGMLRGIEFARTRDWPFVGT
jgi:hypothetical protein